MSAVTSLPSVTIAIATRNDHEAIIRDLVATLYAAPASTESPWLQTLVIDQSTNDETRLALQDSPFWNDPRGEYVHVAEKGISKSHNAALRLARGDIVAFLDSDIRVQPEHVIEIARRFAADPGLAAMFAPVLPDQPTLDRVPDGTIPNVKVERDRLVTPRDRALPAGMGANFAVRREIAMRFPYDEVLGVGSVFPSAEDIDIAVRLHRAGYTYGLFREPAVLHTGVRAGNEVKTWARDTQRGIGAMTSKFARLGSLTHVLGVLQLDTLGLVAGNLRRTGKPTGITRFGHFTSAFAAGFRYRIDREREVYLPRD